MAATPAPADAAATPAPMGDLFQTYDPQGALNGLFAPAYIHGYAPSEKAVADWTDANRLTRAQVEDTRLPPEWRDPAAGQNPPGVGAQGPYGAGGISNNLTFGDPRGSIDPAALKVMAQGGHYDIGARRDAIAARLAANAAAQKAAGAAPSVTTQGLAPLGMTPEQLYAQQQFQNMLNSGGP